MGITDSKGNPIHSDPSYGNISNTSNTSPRTKRNLNRRGSYEQSSFLSDSTPVMSKTAAFEPTTRGQMNFADIGAGQPIDTNLEKNIERGRRKQANKNDRQANQANANTNRTENNRRSQSNLNNDWNAAQDTHNINSDYKSDSNRSPLGADDIRMGRGNYSNGPTGTDTRALRRSPMGNLDMNSTTRKNGMNLAKEMGFNKAELDMVGGMFDANKGYNTAKTGYHAARGASKEATSQYNALKSSIDANRESMTNLTGSAQSKVGKQVSMQEKQLEKMLGTKNSAAGALEQATEYKRAAARNVLGGRSSTNEYINGMASKDAAGVIKNATKDKFSKLGSELAEGKGMNKITKNLKGVGKVGAYAVGALALVGMVQAMNDSKGQQSNSQMYNPGGS